MPALSRRGGGSTVNTAHLASESTAALLRPQQHLTPSSQNQHQQSSSLPLLGGGGVPTSHGNGGGYMYGVGGGEREAVTVNETATANVSGRGSSSIINGGAVSPAGSPMGRSSSTAVATVVVGGGASVVAVGGPSFRAPRSMTRLVGGSTMVTQVLPPRIATPTRGGAGDVGAAGGNLNNSNNNINTNSSNGVVLSNSSLNASPSSSSMQQQLQQDFVPASQHSEVMASSQPQQQQQQQPEEDHLLSSPAQQRAPHSDLAVAAPMPPILETAIAMTAAVAINNVVTAPAPIGNPLRRGTMTKLVFPPAAAVGVGASSGAPSAAASMAPSHRTSLTPTSMMPTAISGGTVSLGGGGGSLMGADIVVPPPPLHHNNNHNHNNQREGAAAPAAVMMMSSSRGVSPSASNATVGLLAQGQTASAVAVGGGGMGAAVSPSVSRALTPTPHMQQQQGIGGALSSTTMPMMSAAPKRTVLTFTATAACNNSSSRSTTTHGVGGVAAGGANSGRTSPHSSSAVPTTGEGGGMGAPQASRAAAAPSVVVNRTRLVLAPAVITSATSIPSAPSSSSSYPSASHANSAPLHVGVAASTDVPVPAHSYSSASSSSAAAVAVTTVPAVTVSSAGTMPSAAKATTTTTAITSHDEEVIDYSRIDMNDYIVEGGGGGGGAAGGKRPREEDGDEEEDEALLRAAAASFNNKSHRHEEEGDALNMFLFAAMGGGGPPKPTTTAVNPLSSSSSAAAAPITAASPSVTVADGNSSGGSGTISGGGGVVGVRRTTLVFKSAAPNLQQQPTTAASAVAGGSGATLAGSVDASAAPTPSAAAVVGSGVAAANSPFRTKPRKTLLNLAPAKTSVPPLTATAQQQQQGAPVLSAVPSPETSASMPMAGSLPTAGGGGGGGAKRTVLFPKGSAAAAPTIGVRPPPPPPPPSSVPNASASSSWADSLSDAFGNRERGRRGAAPLPHAVVPPATSIVPPAEASNTTSTTAAAVMGSTPTLTAAAGDRTVPAVAAPTHQVLPLPSPLPQPTAIAAPPTASAPSAAAPSIPPPSVSVINTGSRPAFQTRPSPRPYTPLPPQAANTSTMAPNVSAAAAPTAAPAVSAPTAQPLSAAPSVPMSSAPLLAVATNTNAAVTAPKPPHQTNSKPFAFATRPTPVMGTVPPTPTPTMMQPPASLSASSTMPSTPSAPIAGGGGGGTASSTSTHQQQHQQAPAASDFYGLPDAARHLYKARGVTKGYEWQEHVLMRDDVLSGRNFVYSLPTSGGKTFVAEVVLMRTLLKAMQGGGGGGTGNNSNNNSSNGFGAGGAGASCIFVLPFVSLAEEKCRALQPFADTLHFNVEGYYGVQGRFPAPSSPTIFVCTIEKANSLYNHLCDEGRHKGIRCVVVDELHMVGEARRGPVLELLLTKIRLASPQAQLVGMSATVPNLQQIADWLGASCYVGTFRPVPLKEHVVFNGVVTERSTEDPREMVNPRPLPSAATSATDDHMHIMHLLTEVPNCSTLVFCATRDQCLQYARQIVKTLDRMRVGPRPEVGGLLADLRGLGHEARNLSELVPYGVAYHTGALSLEERDVVERGYKSRQILILCCTSTLAAGVNLPARRVIFKTPYVAKEFLSKSMYTQMCGRAGRAGYDVFGESFLMLSRRDHAQGMRLVMDSLSPVHSGLFAERHGLARALMESLNVGVFATTSNAKVWTKALMANFTHQPIPDKLLTDAEELVESSPLFPRPKPQQQPTAVPSSSSGSALLKDGSSGTLLGGAAAASPLRDPTRVGADGLNGTAFADVPSPSPRVNGAKRDRDGNAVRGEGGGDDDTTNGPSQQQQPTALPRRPSTSIVAPGVVHTLASLSQRQSSSRARTGEGGAPEAGEERDPIDTLIEGSIITLVNHGLLTVEQLNPSATPSSTAGGPSASSSSSSAGAGSGQQRPTPPPSSSAAPAGHTNNRNDAALYGMYGMLGIVGGGSAAAAAMMGMAGMGGGGGMVLNSDCPWDPAPQQQQQQQGGAAAAVDISQPTHIPVMAQYKLVLTPFGAASVRACFGIEEAMLVREEMEMLQESGVILTDDLQICYLVTPVMDPIECNWGSFAKALSSISDTRSRIARSVGLDVGFVHQRSVGLNFTAAPMMMQAMMGGANGGRTNGTSSSSNTSVGFLTVDATGRKTADPNQRKLYVCRRYYAALVLSDLLNEVPNSTIESRYGLTYTQQQALLRASSIFSSAMVAFCNTMSWFNVEALLAAFVKRLGFGVKPDIIPLMEINGVKASKARVLFAAGFRTPSLIAASNPQDLFKKVRDMNAKDNKAAKFFTLKSAVVVIREANVVIQRQLREKKGELEEMALRAKMS